MNSDNKINNELQYYSMQVKQWAVTVSYANAPLCTVSKKGVTS